MCDEAGQRQRQHQVANWLATAPRLGCDSTSRRYGECPGSVALTSGVVDAAVVGVDQVATIGGAQEVQLVQEV